MDEAEAIIVEHRECGKPKFDGCYAHFPHMAHCRADGMGWPCDVVRLAAARPAVGEEGLDVPSWDKGRWAGAQDALSIVRAMNGDNWMEPSDPALTAAEEAIRRMIERRHGPNADPLAAKRGASRT